MIPATALRPSHVDESGRDSSATSAIADGGRDVDEETVIMNPDDAIEIAGHDGYSAFRVGAGEIVDIHISRDECSIRWIIEDIPRDIAENPGKYLDDEGGDSA
jgi:hypothetical protein